MSPQIEQLCSLCEVHTKVIRPLISWQSCFGLRFHISVRHWLRTRWWQQCFLTHSQGCIPNKREVARNGRKDIHHRWGQSRDLRGQVKVSREWDVSVVNKSENGFRGAWEHLTPSSPVQRSVVTSMVCVYCESSWCFQSSIMILDETWSRIPVTTSSNMWECLKPVLVTPVFKDLLGKGFTIPSLKISNHGPHTRIVPLSDINCNGKPMRWTGWNWDLF